jgi:hypothetical protein
MNARRARTSHAPFAETVNKRPVWFAEFAERT